MFFTRIVGLFCFHLQQAFMHSAHNNFISLRFYLEFATQVGQGLAVRFGCVFLVELGV